MAKQIEMMSADVELVSKLGDQPNQENGLTAEELKAVFDRGSKRLKEYVNETLVPAVNELAESDGKSIKNDQLPKAINAALDQAKESGEFNGGYYVPIVDQTNASTMRIEFTPSDKGAMPPLEPVRIELPPGPRGATGKTAYAYAKDGGYTGTEEEFAAKLAEVNRISEKQEAAFWVAAELDYQTGAATVEESAAEIFAAYEAKRPCYMRARVTNPVSDAYQILVLQSVQKSNTGNGGKYYRLVFQQTSTVETESEAAGDFITCSYLDEVVVSSFEGTAQNVCFRTQISPNANALTIGEQVYDGSVAVDMTDNINSMIDAKGRILLYEWAGINGGSFPAGNLTATDMVGEYSGVEVLFYCKRGGSLVSSGFIPKDTLYPNGAVAIGVTDAGELVTRTVKYSGNVFTFGSAKIGTGADERLMLPWRIYGYK